jgi:mono/diheme cytochrome c family protein
MRYVLLVFLLIGVAVVSVAGFRGDKSRRPPIELFPDMDRQPKLRPQTTAEFFTDGMSSRLPVEGTVARGSTYEINEITTGRLPSPPGVTNFVASIPVPVTADLLERGRQRYDIHCAPCHSASGDGKGITGNYGMVGMANFHDIRLVQMRDGEMFDTITHGKNTMGSYAAALDVPDRWAVVAYIRALQRSRLAVLDDVPVSERQALKQ